MEHVFLKDQNSLNKIDTWPPACLPNIMSLVLAVSDKKMLYGFLYINK